MVGVENVRGTIFQREGRDLMKRGILIAVGVVVVLGLATALLLTQRRVKQTRLEVADARAAEDSIRGRYKAALDAIITIQDSLTAIMPSESEVLGLSRN